MWTNLECVGFKGVLELNIAKQSDEFLLVEHLLDGNVALAGRSHEARNSDDARFAQIDSAVSIDLN